MMEIMKKYISLSRKKDDSSKRGLSLLVLTGFITWVTEAFKFKSGSYSYIVIIYLWSNYPSL